MKRREVLQLGVAAAVGTAVAGCSRFAPLLASGSAGLAPLPDRDVSSEARLLNRLGFGPRPGGISRIAAIPRREWIERELAATLPEEARLQLLLSGLEIFSLGSEEMKDIRKEHVVLQLQQADMLCAVYGQNQLKERMVDFWLDHFNVYALKSDIAWKLATASRRVIRDHALGKFPKMLRISARSPAMLAYLDNSVNTKGVANENYARELMELHTLGVHGGYSQEDVMEVARCFTGWTVEDRFLHRKGCFRFNPDAHDFGRKVVMGHVIPAGGGEEDGEAVLSLLARHPATGRHLAGKLVRYFLGHNHERWQARLTETYLATDGDITEMLRPLMHSEDVLSAPPIPKRPKDFVVSALRATDARTDCGAPLLERLTAMGQGAYMWPMPDGYPSQPEAWGGSMLGRWNFAQALVAAHIPGTTISAGVIERPAENILARRLKPRDAVGVQLERLSPQARVALCLASPEFQWR